MTGAPVFWMVAGDDCVAPARYCSQERAIETAERLAAAFPGEYFYVMVSICERRAGALAQIEQKLADITEELPAPPAAPEQAP